ncbi:Roadblock/LC7 domain protein [Candidatus Tiddalikarchaeum anstoanum]|nr:Roadblock/LC7 domain protein [Candidatus Tiddalikarchaeum anstoanum]
MDVEHELYKVLEEINEIKEVSGSMLVTDEGIPIVGSVAKNLEKLDFSAMSAALAGAARTIIQTVSPKDKLPDSIILESAHAKLVLYLVDSSIILVLATPNLKTDDVINFLKERNKQIENLLKK